MRPKDIQTIEELFARNFTIYGHKMTAKMMKAYTADKNVTDFWRISNENQAENEFSNRFSRVFLCSHLIAYLASFRIYVIADNASIVDLLADGSNNAFITDSEYLRFLEKSLNGTKKFTQLKEIVMSDYLGFSYRNNHFIFKPVDRIVGQLYESGIAQRVVDQESALTYEEISDEPVVLTMRHLGIWFFAGIFMLVVALVAFISELVVARWCRK
jgi:hypothetical protein